MVLVIDQNEEITDFEKNKILTPEYILAEDLALPLNQVRSALSIKKEACDFPIKIRLTCYFLGRGWVPCFRTRTRNEDIPPIIGGLLEKEGWVVYTTPECKPYEIMVDVPRSKLQKPE